MMSAVLPLRVQDTEPPMRKKPAKPATPLPGALADLLTVEELGRQFRLSPKTLKALAHEADFPLWRFTPRGGLFAYASEVELWLSTHRMPLKAES